MTLVDVHLPETSDAAGLRAAFDAARAGPGTPGAADALVVLLHYGRPADAALLGLLHDPGHRGAIGVLARAAGGGEAVTEAGAKYGEDPAGRRVCEAVGWVAPAAAAAAARLGD